MGCRNRMLVSEEGTPSSASSSSSFPLSEALLLATMCIVGLPVDVHVKDGSIYSGIFHTSSVEKDYGIVLKKARMTKKGKSNANVAKGAVIDTLIILSDDLVQVVAKGAMLPADGLIGNVVSDDRETIVSIVPSSSPTTEVEKSNNLLMDNNEFNKPRSQAQPENGFSNGFRPSIVGSEGNQIRNPSKVDNGKSNEISLAKIDEYSGSSMIERQAGDDKSKGQNDDFRQKFELIREKAGDTVHGSCSNVTSTSLNQSETAEGGQTDMPLKLPVNGLLCNNNAPAPAKPDVLNCGSPTSADSTTDAILPNVSTATTSPGIFVSNALPKSVEISVSRSSESNRNSKEFKLNPGAKIFSPSFANPISATPLVPTVANVTYMPNNSPVVTAAPVQPEVGFNPFVSRTSVPLKFAQYHNLTAGNVGSGSQFSQPVVGQMGPRTQPLRYANQYNPVLPEPAYVHPSSPAVMVGRLGQQLFYVHPSSHDLTQGAAPIPPVSVHPILTQNNVQFPKQPAGQAMQFCAPQPVITSGQQLFSVPNHIPILQPPYPANRPTQVPGSNGFYNTKFW